MSAEGRERVSAPARVHARRLRDACARLKREALAARASITFDAARESGIAARAAAFEAFVERERGGSTTTRCSARCTTSTAAATGASGSAALRDRDPAALDDARDAAGAETSATTSTCSGSPTSSGSGPARRAARVGHLRRLSRSWSAATAPTSGRASTSSTSTRRSACRRRPIAGRARTGACRRTAGTSSRRADYEWLRAAHPPLRRALRRLPRRSPGRLLSHLHPRARRRDRFSPPDEPSQIAQGERADGAVPRARRPHHRRGPRRRPGLRPRVAGADAACRASRCCAGSANGHAGPARSAIRALTRRARSRSAARTIPRRWPSGGTAPTTTSAAPCCRDPGAPRGRRAISPTKPFSRPHPRRAARSALPRRLRLVLVAVPGPLRLARSHQHAGGRQRRELDLAAALAGRDADQRSPEATERAAFLRALSRSASGDPNPNPDPEPNR